MWKIEGVVRVLRVVRVAAQRLAPGDHLAGVFDDVSPLRSGLQREHALAVHARAAHLDAAAARRGPHRECGSRRASDSRVGACVSVFIRYIEFMGARACVRAREMADCMDVSLGGAAAARTWAGTIKEHEQVTDHCGEAQRRAGHRARADAQRRQVRQARRALRERALRRHLGGRPPGGDQGARGVRRQARQVELRPPAGDAAALRPGADRQGQVAPERGGQAGQAQGRDAS